MQPTLIAQPFHGTAGSTRRSTTAGGWSPTSTGTGSASSVAPAATIRGGYDAALTTHLVSVTGRLGYQAAQEIAR